MIVDLASKLWPVQFTQMSAYSIEAPEIGFAEDAGTLLDLTSRVVLFNDNIHSFDEVIVQVSKALTCDINAASHFAWEAHVHGQSFVFEGEMFECLRVSSVLEEIALHTQVLT